MHKETCASERGGVECTCIPDDTARRGETACGERKSDPLTGEPDTSGQACYLPRGHDGFHENDCYVWRRVRRTQPAAQEAERAFEEWCHQVSLPFGLHPVELRAFTAGYRRGRAETDDHARLPLLAALTALEAKLAAAEQENARLREVSEDRRKNIYVVERELEEAKDKLAAAEQALADEKATIARQTETWEEMVKGYRERERRLRALLEDALDSLEYVQMALPGATGAAVRFERIEEIRAALAEGEGKGVIESHHA